MSVVEDYSMLFTFRMEITGISSLNANICLWKWEEWSLTEKTWPGLLYGNLRISQSYHKNCLFLKLHLPFLSLPPVTRSHTFFSYERGCVLSLG